MKRELLASETSHIGLHLDPRTKLAVLITISVFVLGGSGGDAMRYFAPVLSAIPLLLLLSARKIKISILYLVLYGGSWFLDFFMLPKLSGIANFLVLAICALLLRFVPGIMMGYYTIKTMTVSEFIAAMEKIHLPQQITIPLSVMFRFFPTVLEEYNAINDAMKMRGIRFGGGKAGAILEYRIVPMIMCSVKIGEELSAAALTRGLGGPVKRTNICQIGFHIQDIIMLFVCFSAFVFRLYILLVGR